MPDLSEMRELMEIVEAGKVSNHYPQSLVWRICEFDNEESERLMERLAQWGFICNDPHFERVDPNGLKRWIWTYQYRSHMP